MGHVPIVIWHGSVESSIELANVVQNNCTCSTGRGCGAHEAMLDQRWLDTILFLRFIRKQLLKEEGVPCKSERSGRTR